MAQQGWTVDAGADTITFTIAPPAGTNNVVVRQYAGASRNVTDIWAIGAWNDEYGYPSEVEFYSDRLVFANTPAQPQTVWMSETGNYSSFRRSQPVEDSDGITATLNARRVNAVRDLVPLDALLLLTSGGEWKTTAGQEDVLSPTTIGFKTQSYNGASDVPALVVGNSALYVQDRGYKVRDLAYQFDVDGYTGGDLTVFSQHLLEGFSVVEWAYQQTPYSIVWLVRSDGVLLAMTYMREQEVVGWSRMEMDGEVESVTVVPEADQDAVYVAIKRTINGATKRYVERLSSRIISEAREGTFLDSFLTYDGRTAGGVGTSIDIGAVGGEYIIFAAAPIFAATDVGDEIVLRYGTSTTIRFRVTVFSGANQVFATPDRTPDPADIASASTTDWVWARDTISGLGHLEGKTVGILADGFVQAPRVVTGGAITLDSPSTVVHVGLPYTADFETLEVNVPGAESTRLRFKNISRVGLIVQDSRSIRAGPDADNLDEYDSRQFESYDEPPALQQDLVEMWISKEWANRGRVFVRQSDPLPLSILGVIPDVEFGV